MEPKLFKYIWRHSRRDQIGILFLVLLSMPFYFVSLDLPKSIVNMGIQGEGFDLPSSTQPLFRLELPFGDRVVLFDGIELQQADFLLGLSFAFLGFVFVNGAFKFFINTLKGRLGERMLRRLRYELADRILRFPIPYSRRIKQAEVATMIKDEVEPLGGFIGDAFVTPAFLGGQAITAMAFIMIQSVWLGLVAAAIVLVQAFLIPKLRKRILRLGKERQLTARQLAGRVAELIEGAVEIHAHDTSNLERADISARLGRIYDIRYEIFRRKFSVKFLNNFLAQLTPFVFYSAGGLLAISGRLDIGALVAVIAAYKDLPSPIKELIDWDQQRLDVQIKYDQVIEQFQPPEILDPARQDPAAEPGPPLDGDLAVKTVSLVNETGTRLVDSVSFTMPLTAQLAIVGNSASGKEHLGMLLANLLRPTSGSISLNGRDIETMPQALTGRRISYVGQDAYLFPMSVSENLLYGLKHRPLVAADYDAADGKARARAVAESLRAGNATFDTGADWVDYAAAGAGDSDELAARIIQTLAAVDMEEDVYQFGLTGSIDARARPAVADGILAARAALVGRLADEGASDLVVRFDPEQYNPNATLAENLLFGTPTKPEFKDEALAENPIILEFLREEGVSGNLLKMGETIARTMVELFADLPSGHPFFEQFGFMEEDELPDFGALLGRADKTGVEALPPGDQLKLRRLPFKYVESRHRLGLIDEARAARIVSARRRIAARLEKNDPGAVEFYQPDSYNTAASLQDNILFGRFAFGRARAEETVGRVMTEVLDSLGLRQTVLAVGLDYQVGVGGRRLTGIQRQKLAIARALLKQPDLLIVNEAAAAMDSASQQRIQQRILAARRGHGVIWTLQRAASAANFDRVLVMRSGRLVQQGTFNELNEPGSALGELVAAG